MLYSQRKLSVVGTTSWGGRPMTYNCDIDCCKTCWVENHREHKIVPLDLGVQNAVMTKEANVDEIKVMHPIVPSKDLRTIYNNSREIWQEWPPVAENLQHSITWSCGKFIERNRLCIKLQICYKAEAASTREIRESGRGSEASWKTTTSKKVWKMLQDKARNAFVNNRKWDHKITDIGKMHITLCNSIHETIATF